jgi:uncharacterized protein YycO
MKKRILPLFCFLSILMSCTQSVPPKLDKILQEGDLVFRKGVSLESYAVLLAAKKGIYSHVGIVVKDVEDSLFIVHAVPGESINPDGVDYIKKEKIAAFFDVHRSSAGAIMRVKCSAQVKHEAAQIAFQYYKLKKEFDHDYNDADTTRLYCTELVYNAYRNVGISIADSILHKIGIPFGCGQFRFPSDIQQHNNVYEILHF